MLLAMKAKIRVFCFQKRLMSKFKHQLLTIIDSGKGTQFFLYYLQKHTNITALSMKTKTNDLVEDFTWPQ